LSATLAKPEYQLKTKPQVKEKDQKAWNEQSEELKKVEESLLRLRKVLSTPQIRKKYYEHKIKDAEDEIQKRNKNLVKLNEKLPKDYLQLPPTQQPKKTLTEISETKQEIDKLQVEIGKFQLIIKEI